MALAGIAARFLGAVKIGRLFLSHHKGLVAATTQTQVAATQLDRAMNFIATCANSGDGVKLPAFEESKIAVVINGGAQPARVYSHEATAVTIGGTAGATGILLAAGKAAIFFAASANRWDQLLSA